MVYLSGNTSGKRLDALKCGGIGLMVTYPRGIPRSRHDLVFACDNGCFKYPDLDTAKYLRWLDRIPRTALFAPGPDVVGDSRATWERSEPVLPQIRALGHRAALVAQDGIEDGPIRWAAFDCLFIGGSTEWKLSDAVLWLCKQARREGKWIHLGRVNSRRRLRFAAMAGCDSVDGTHARFGPDVRVPQMRRWLEELKRQPFLECSDEEETDLLCWFYARI